MFLKVLKVLLRGLNYSCRVRWNVMAIHVKLLISVNDNFIGHYVSPVCSLSHRASYTTCRANPENLTKLYATNARKAVPVSHLLLVAGGSKL